MNDESMEKEASTLITQLGQAIDGLTNDWPAAQQAIVYQQTTYTPAQLIAVLETALAPLQAVPDARSALKTAIANRLAALPNTIAVVNGFYAVLPQYLPAGADTTRFGAKAKKVRRQPTAEEKTVSNAKRAATRTARHIMGKNQRKAIKAPPTPATPPATPTH
jgi:hypothetical protein